MVRATQWGVVTWAKERELRKNLGIGKREMQYISRCYVAFLGGGGLKK